MTVNIKISLWRLWELYGTGHSGRAECPIILANNQQVTHIYRGYGAIRLERIAGEPENKKGFQGKEVAYSRDPGAERCIIAIQD